MAISLFDLKPLKPIVASPANQEQQQEQQEQPIKLSGTFTEIPLKITLPQPTSSELEPTKKEIEFDINHIKTDLLATSNQAIDQAQALAGSVDEVILTNLVDLQTKLESANPDIRMNLIIIHRALAKDPAVVTILTREQRAAIFQAYKRQAGIEIVAVAAKSKAKGKQTDISMFT